MALRPEKKTVAPKISTERVNETGLGNAKKKVPRFRL